MVYYADIVDVDVFFLNYNDIVEVYKENDFSMDKIVEINLPPACTTIAYTVWVSVEGGVKHGGKTDDMIEIFATSEEAEEYKLECIKNERENGYNNKFFVNEIAICKSKEDFYLNHCFWDNPYKKTKRILSKYNLGNAKCCKYCNLENYVVEHLKGMENIDNNMILQLEDGYNMNLSMMFSPLDECFCITSKSTKTFDNCEIEISHCPFCGNNLNELIKQLKTKNHMK